MAGFENLLVALLFLLPGFLTSRLISARTPALGKEASDFQDTLGSLLRSVYIHLFIAPIFIILIWYFRFLNNATLSDAVFNGGLQVYYVTRPFEVTILLFVWLFSSFLLALFFGYKWDPLEALFLKLVNKTGTESEDLFYQLRKNTEERRKKGQKNNQLWMQVRLKNSCVYQGEFSFIGYRHDGMSRELLLTNVTYISNAIQETESISAQNISTKFDFVYIDISNCESIEILFGANSEDNQYPRPQNKGS